MQSSNFSAKLCQQIVTEKNEPCFVQGKYPCVNKEKLMLPNSFCHTVTCSNLEDVPKLNFSYHTNKEKRQAHVKKMGNFKVFQKAE